MGLARELAERLADVLRRGVLFHAECPVIVLLLRRRHSIPSERSSSNLRSCPPSTERQTAPHPFPLPFSGCPSRSESPATKHPHLLRTSKSTVFHLLRIANQNSFSKS